ncbi:large conductance mechanosensitive channel protein MscL [Hyphomonas sp.]|uniref:large conductance mechanosensitive channel protein MscL n=1 Tax=Hyphomonas sp. TaxID=87 RepID=UPI0025BC925A|nr:large conductance mechanosensitive channel protein MscL [Hyphomonas sp.]
MLKEFKEFAMKGNLVDMAVGFVMGGAFATVVTAFIQGVFLPLLAPIMGGLDLSALTYTVSPAELNEAGEVVKEAAVVELGNFISAIISFLIVAFVMFMIIKGMNNMKKKEEETAPAAPPRQEVLLEEIRNLLAKQS